MSSDTTLTVLFALSGNRSKASSRVRGFWIAENLKESGVKCTLRWKNSRSDMVRLAFEMLHHDVIVFQKTYSRYHRWIMTLARLMGKRTFLDLDDSPSRSHSSSTLRNVESMMQMADGVFVGNQNLLEYARRHQPNAHLVASGIKLSNYTVNEPAMNGESVCVGWVGNGAHYKQDLISILEEPLRRVADKHSLRFKLVGACGEQELYDVFTAIPGLEVNFIDQVEWSNPEQVSKATSDFDIGLYPLLPNDFNQYKCGFKALEYMARGIPVVSSPVAINADIVRDGVSGLLATSVDEWVAALSQLVDKPDRRREMGQAGRQIVEASFDVSMIADQIYNMIRRKG